MEIQIVGQMIVHCISLGVIIALMAIGFNLVFGILRIVNYWHGEAYMLGAVLLFMLTARAAIEHILAMILAIVIVGMLGWLCDVLVTSHFRNNLLGGAIATLALLMLFENSAWLYFGPVPKSMESFVQGNLGIFGVILSAERLLVVAVSVAVILALAWFIKYSKLGKAMRAVQQDSEAALTMGINVNRVCAFTFGVATALAALAGTLCASLYSIHPAMGLRPLLFAFIVVIVGGLGSVMGAFVASIIVGIQYSLTMAFIGPEYAMAASWGLALVILMVLPRGLMGRE